MLVLLKRSLILAVVAALLAVPLMPHFIYPVFAMKVMCFALFACAYNLLLGHTGIVSFGHAAFFGTAAYVTGYAMRELGLPPEISIAAGVIGSAGLGAAIGALAIRRQGIYLAMITLALAQLVYFVFLQAEFTGAEDGMQEIPRGVLFGLIDLRSDFNLFYVVMALTGAGLWLVYRIVNSPFGEVLRAIREHEPRARSLGYAIEKYKILAFALSAGLSGLAGSLKCIVFQLASLTDVHWHMSGEVILMTLLGGMPTVFGPAIGAILVSALHHYFDALGAWVTIVIGLIFILCVLVFRRGVAGQLHHMLQERRPTAPSAERRNLKEGQHAQV
ncbi:branched-chain amino acid ABC transporter permease [Bradyrhizobium retamae]|uniref:ABC transporter permease n=1 Tax=Bradyrhizobium retamae TaxID=1300035 RepID=A0A0R3MSU8_9BRAD|nr:branched-chain amino acid ABC transporter permease [Bradyrhizobium retamae]KRR22670.1 ABC transporter permease [Bradyrhizobium retamae]